MEQQGAVEVFAAGQQAGMVGSIFHRQQGAVMGGGSQGSWGDQLPAEDITTLSPPCHRPPTPSYLCTLAWFATSLQIISFNLPVTQTLLKIASFEKLYLIRSPFSLRQAFHLWQKTSRSLEISKDPGPGLVQISRASVPVTRIGTQPVLYPSAEVPSCFMCEQRPPALHFY